MEDTNVSSKYLDINESYQDQSEKKLMRALLIGAVKEYAGMGLGDPRYKSIIMRSGERWIRTKDRMHPFSFDNVCGYLGMDADNSRRALLATPVEELKQIIESRMSQYSYQANRRYGIWLATKQQS